MTDAMYPMLESPREISRLPQFTVPKAVVLDYDRTLGDVDAAMERLYSVAGSFSGFNKRLLVEAQAQTEADGGSFNPLTYIEQLLDPSQFGQFEKQFVRSGGPELLYPEAVSFLGRLMAHKVPYCVLTYGKSQQWQELKLTASGYDGAAQIISHSDKGRELASWQAETGFYEFVGCGQDAQPRAIIRALGVIMIDDKIQSLRGLPQSARGIYVDRKNSEVDLPEDCIKVRSLSNIALPSSSSLLEGISAYHPLISS